MIFPRFIYFLCRKNLLLHYNYIYRKDMEDKPKTLQEHAMRFGTMMGIFWIIKFSFLPIGFKIPLYIYVNTENATAAVSCHSYADGYSRSTCISSPHSLPQLPIISIFVLSTTAISWEHTWSNWKILNQL